MSSILSIHWKQIGIQNSKHMDELLIPEVAQPKKQYSTPPKWSNAKEFDDGKTITPTGFARLCGTQTTAKPEFRDKEGCTYRLSFIDHDNGGVERFYENCYQNFYEDVARGRVVKGRKYFVE